MYLPECNNDRYKKNVWMLAGNLFCTPDFTIGLVIMYTLQMKRPPLQYARTGAGFQSHGMQFMDQF